MSDTDALAKRLSVSEVVGVYERAEADVRAAFDLLARAERTLNETFQMGDLHTIHVRDRYSHRSMNYAEVEGTLTELRRDCWGALVERLELRKVMSIKAWEELQEQLRKGDVPPIDQETVSQMAQQFRDQMPAMLEAAVQEVFEWLRPPGSKYKRNSELEVPERVILGYCIERGWRSHGNLQVNYRREQHLTALERVFLAIDGKGQTTRGHYSDLSGAIKTAPKPWTGETEYFEFRACLNGNLHLRFRRLDLLARFNQIAGGARLRPAPAGSAA